MKNKLILCIALFSLSLLIIAQVGINTTSPQAMLDIRSQGSTASTMALAVKNNTGNLLFGIRDDGRVQLTGVTTPKVLLDLRGGDDNNIVGIGNSSLASSIAGQGAVKYDTNTRSLYLADNSTWKELSSDHIKAFVVADITVATQAFAHNATSTIVGWHVLSDLTSSFNPSTGIFTAQRRAIYSISINVTFNDGNVVAGSQIRATLTSSSGQQIKCITTYNDAGSIPSGVQCDGSFDLNIGQTLYTTLWHNLGTTKYIKVGYSNLTIVEL